MQKNQRHCEKRQQLDIGYKQELKVQSEENEYAEFRSFLQKFHAHNNQHNIKGTLRGDNY